MSIQQHSDKARKNFFLPGDTKTIALDFPFRIDPRDRSAEVVADAHIREMIEQVLFTVPGGDGVNQPDFGCGLLQLVFAPNSDALAAAMQSTV